MSIQTNIYNFLKAVEANKNLSMISLSVVNKDNILFDFKKEPYLADGKQLVFSVTKSFTSLAIGMLYDKGLLTLDTYMINYFKDELPKNYDPLLNKITIRHLLTMTSGIVKENNKDMLKTNDYRTYFLSQKVEYEPGTHYHYHSATSHMLSAIFTKITGKTVESYLNKHLFIPLNIKNYHWAQAPEGVSFGGYGLSLNNDALIKLGQLLLGKGMYQGKRYISDDYLKLATSPQSIKQDYVDNPNAQAIGYQYGFQFHVSPNQSFRADGAFGQIVVIYNDLAIISTAQYTDYEFLYKMIYKHFETIEYDDKDDEDLLQFIDKLTFKEAGINESLNIDRTYEIEPNPLGIHAIKFSHNYILFKYQDKKEDRIDYNFRQDQYGNSFYVKDLGWVKQPHWVIPKLEKDTLVLKILYIETPFFAEYTFKFNQENLKFSFNPSPNFLLNGFTVASQ